MLDVELSITSGLGKTTRRENVVNNDTVEEEQDEEDEAFATRIKQEVVLLATQANNTDHVSKLSKPIWPKSSPTIPTSLFKNDFQTKVFSWFEKVPIVARSTGQPPNLTLFCSDRVSAAAGHGGARPPGPPAIRGALPAILHRLLQTVQPPSGPGAESTSLPIPDRCI